MVLVGYTMMTEQPGPREFVVHGVGAERAGFDFSVASDHFFPWLNSQGRFRLGLGSGETLHEHVGVNAKLWDLPEKLAAFGIAVSGWGNGPARSSAGWTILTLPPSPGATCWTFSTDTAVQAEGCPSATTPTGMRRSHGRTTSAAGRSAAGRSTQSYPCRPEKTLLPALRDL